MHKQQRPSGNDSSNAGERPKVKREDEELGSRETHDSRLKGSNRSSQAYRRDRDRDHLESNHDDNYKKNNYGHGKGHRPKVKQEHEEHQRWGNRRQRSVDDEPMSDSKDEKPPVQKELPNYKPSGLLAVESKKLVNGKVLKYHEPLDSAMPPRHGSGPQYRIYVFQDEDDDKQNDMQDVFVLDQKEWYLFGRDRQLCDIPVDIPSCSSQHAVIQFRKRHYTDALGQSTETVKPYLMDIDSSYGTTLNGETIPQSRYIELRDKDVIQFASHPREYLFMVDSEEDNTNSI